jgi:hypothetical protein
MNNLAVAGLLAIVYGAVIGDSRITSGGPNCTSTLVAAPPLEYSLVVQVAEWR